MPPFLSPSNKPADSAIFDTSPDSLKLKVKIDRLSVTLAEHDEEEQEAILSSLYVASNDTGQVQNLSSKGKPYFVNLGCWFGPSKGHVFVQAGAKSPKNPFIRLDMNPSKLGPKGMEELYAFLSTTLEDGWGAFLKKGRVTRFDAAIDLPGTVLSEFHVLPTTALKSQTWSRQGHVQSIVLGSNKSKRQISIYNKSAEEGSVDNDLALTRIEIRVRKTFKLVNLKSVDNPLACLTAVKFPPPPKDIKPYLYDLIQARSQINGLVSTLANLPRARRNKLRKHLKSHPVEWWEPDQIWAGWPSALDALGLLDDPNL